MIKIVLALSSIVLLFTFGCAGTQKPTAEQLSSADYGRFPHNYEEITKEYISSRLIDPDSGKFSDWVSPTKSWYKNFGDTFFGYRTCVFVNAKNRMGGYTGRKLYYVMIKNDRVIVQDGGDYRPGTMGEQRVYELCR